MLTFWRRANMYFGITHVLITSGKRNGLAPRCKAKGGCLRGARQSEYTELIFIPGYTSEAPTLLATRAG